MSSILLFYPLLPGYLYEKWFGEDSDHSIFSLCASHNNLCCCRAEPRSQRDPEGLTEASQVPLGQLPSSQGISQKCQTALKHLLS